MIVVLCVTNLHGILQCAYAVSVNKQLSDLAPLDVPYVNECYVDEVQ